MDINEFMSGYKNHPVLFIGTGISLRYLKNSFTWDGLLLKISTELTGSDEQYYELKSKHIIDNDFKYDKIASDLEKIFNQKLVEDRHGKFKEVNDLFFEEMRKGRSLSRFKIYISVLLSDIETRENIDGEISYLLKASKNIGSIVTTNYDKFIQDTFEFKPLIGNDILLSNPYGSIYKIHGCVSDPSKIIIGEDDYSKFKAKFELIRAQLLSLFIHNPIIFIGYSINDENIKEILKTIFTYVDKNSDIADRVRRNFLLVEHEDGNESNEVVEHDIDLQGFSTIRINKIKTNNFISIYKAISNLNLPISAMDVKKVQSIVREIYSGGKVKVNITEDIENLKNSDKIVVIGSEKTIQYYFQTTSEMMSNYFRIIDESNNQLIKLINKQKISVTQYFPIYGFSKICEEINDVSRLKRQQREKIENLISTMKPQCKNSHETINEIINDNEISNTNKSNAIVWAIFNGKINTNEAKEYLKNYKEKNDTGYKKILCCYDYKTYGDELFQNIEEIPSER